MFQDNINGPHKSIIDGKPGMFGGSNWLYWMLQMGYPKAAKSEPDPFMAMNVMEVYKDETNKKLEEVAPISLNEYLSK